VIGAKGIAERMKKLASVMDRFLAFWNRPQLGLLLLLISFAIGSALIHWGSFLDESDNLAAGLLISHGDVLYRDIFSHHFPFTYYWVAAVFWLFGPSIFIARLSMLSFQLVSFVWAMRLTHLYVPIGLASLIWSVTGHYYQSNLVLYSAFSSISLAVVFAITLARAGQLTVLRRRELLTLGGFSAIAIVADPLSIHAVGVAILVLALARVKLQEAIAITAIIVLALVVCFGSLLVTHTLQDFYREVILFNSNVYSKYTYTKTVRLNDILQLAVSLFNLLGVKPWLVPSFSHRLLIVLCSAVLLIRRRFLMAGLVYFFAAASLVISPNTFRSNGFILVSLLAAAWIVLENLGQGHMQNDVTARFSAPSPRHPDLSRTLLLKLFRQAPWLAVGSILAWILVNGATHILRVGWNHLSYRDNFETFESKANFILNDLACGHHDAALAYYPGDPIYNFLTGMEPVSGYLFMWPWVAEIALPQVIKDLQSGHAVVYLDSDYVVWRKYASKDYLADLRAYLDKNYEEVRQGFYVSSDLARECHTLEFYPKTNIPPQVPTGELVQGTRFTQTFVSECAGMSRLDLYLASYARDNSSSVAIRLTDTETHQRVFERVISGSDIADDEWHKFAFEPVSDSKGKQYRVVMIGLDGQPGNAITIWRSQADVFPGGKASTNDIPIDADLVFQYGCSK
jgi:hypothetical protein